MKAQLSKQWIQWLRELQSIAQIGRSYCKDYFCQERYDRLNNIAAEITAQYSEQEFEVIRDFFQKEIDYATPKIDVRAVVFQNQKLLMVQEIEDGLWSLPGGWADVNNSPAESVVREVFEETGFQVEATKLLAFYDKHKHDHPPQWPHAYKAFYLCEMQGGKATPSYETPLIKFFAENALPELSTNRVTKKQIQLMFEHARHPEWPTDFD